MGLKRGFLFLKYPTPLVQQKLVLDYRVGGWAWRETKVRGNPEIYKFFGRKEEEIQPPSCKRERLESYPVIPKRSVSTGRIWYEQLTTEWLEWMSHRKQKEAKQQPGTAGPGNIFGCSLVSLRFLCDIHSIQSLIFKGAAEEEESPSIHHPAAFFEPRRSLS